ncbi:MAG: peptide chain release factor 1 [Patescibacteria group bacterium]|jgi:peptide chain release factor 1
MYQEIKDQLAALEAELLKPEVQSDQKNLIKLSREHLQVKKIVDKINDWENLSQEIADNQELLKTETDSELLAMVTAELETATPRLKQLAQEIDEALNPQDPNDQRNAIIEIRSGAGGDEASLFAGDLFRMYARYCEEQRWQLSLISSSMIGIGGYKEVIFSVTGENAYGYLKYEAGTHRVQRVPETEKQGRVHTSTATVVVLPEAEEVDIEINPQDIRIDTFCSSGPGGQSVNTTYSAIRITHLPTGLIVSCQDEKSQHQNKEKALQVLRSRLLAIQEEDRLAKESSARKSQVGAGDRSDKIRTYNFPQDRLTDHRLNLSWHGLTKIMAGDLKEIITALKAHERETQA